MTHQSGVRSAACGRTEEEEAAVLAEARAVVAASGLFDTDHYLWHLPEAAVAGLDPIEHYLREGWHRDADPGPGFSTHYYVAVNDDVRESGLNPLVHYVKWGKAEGRLPVPQPLRPAGAAVRLPCTPTPEEWEALAAAWNGPTAEPEVDVLVPVYGGFDETMRCLFSVLSARPETPHRLIVVDDCTPDPKLCAGVEALAARGLIELHRTPQNLGFVGACNLGMALHRSRDVVLLNSDTEVFGDWLDRLRAAALRRPRTGTVTPLSNNAEICSYPHFVRDNRQQLEVDDATLDRLAALANAGSEVEIPTGVGFCMYVRRACLDEVGLFDVESFGKGYGEENDLCRRAAAAGWRNILAPDIFVRHHGAASFGAGKAAFVALALKTVERLHPGYLRLVGEFIESDPVRPFREALDVARLTSRARMGAILFVTHSWGGGTERHVQDLSSLLEADGTPVFFCRVDAEIPGRVRIEDPGALETPNLRTFDVERDLGRFAATLRRIGVAHVHVQSLAGYPESAPDFIRSACAASDLAYDVTLHDYAAVCPRIHLIDRSGIYCGEPDLATCERCIGRDGSPFGRPSVWLWRDRYARFLSGARRVFVPHADVARRMRRFLPRVAFIVRPHPEPPPPRRAPSPAAAATSASRPKAGRPRRVALLGAIGPHKGSILLADTARAASAQGLPLEFVVVGYTDRDDELRALGNVEITGRFEEGEAAARLAAAGADIAWFPAVWPETYSYTLSAALDARVFPVAFDFGAIGARIYASGWGDVMPIGLMLDPAAVARRLAEVPVPPPPSDVGHLHAAAVYVDPLASYYQLRDPATPVSSAATPSAAFGNRDPWIEVKRDTPPVAARTIAASPASQVANTLVPPSMASAEAPAAQSNATMTQTGIRPYYEKRPPSAQAVVDLFRGSWKSALPGDLVAGDALMFKDGRPRWAASQIPGGFEGKSVLDLGPFEGYQTYLMLQEGAREVVSVEANSVNFLKCLCVKEIYDIAQARFVFGDIVGYVRDCEREFDVAWASGMLYHLQDPILFIERISRIARYSYVWTHYFDAEVMAALRNGQERHFLPHLDQVQRCSERDIALRARSYLLPDYESDMPTYWEGGLEQITYWLAKNDILWLFERAGTRIVSVESDDTNINGLPAIGFLATRA